MIRHLLAGLRGQLRDARILTLLTVFGVALGVGAVLSVQLLNGSALAAFGGGVRAVGGESDLTVTGRGPWLDETLYPGILADPAVRAAWPVFRAEVSLGSHDDLLEIVGVDLFAPTALPAVAGPDGLDPVAFLHERGRVGVSRVLAAERGWSLGDTLRTGHGSRTVPLVVGAVLDFERGAPLASRRTAVMDIAQAQGLFGGRGRLSSVDLRLDPGADPAGVAARLEAALGPAAAVRTPAQREQDAASLLDAFRLNLTALSLVSVFVGLFLVTSAVQASLARRRTEFGVLRSLGATRGQVLGLVLAEAGLLGLAGTLVGVPVAVWGAQANLERVSGTLTSIYLLDAVERLVFPPWLWALAAFVGVGGALLGALRPALELARREPRELLSVAPPDPGTLSGALRSAAAGAVLVALCAGVYLLRGDTWRGGGFLLAAGLLVGVPLWTPLLVRGLSGLVRPRRLDPAYGVRNLRRKPASTALATAALGVAVSMLVAVTLLIAGFRSTLVTWLDATLPADVYVTTESWVREGELAALDAELADALTDRPGVIGSERLRQVGLEAHGRRIRLNAVAFDRPDSVYALPLKEGRTAEALRRMRDGAVIVSEPLARRAGLSIGDSLRVMTVRGEARLPVAAVSYDYSSEAGLAYCSPATLDRLVGPGPINNVSLTLAPGLDPDRTVAELRAEFAGTPLWIRSNRQLREDVLTLFDQTFAVTRLLQGMALLIAVCGVSLTLLVQARERAAELALYRALGATSGQVFRVLASEGAAMGALGAVLGLAGGVGLAMILVHVINPQWFGWSIRAAWPLGDVARQLLAILLAALAASLLPARRGSRTPARELTREDLA